MRNVQIREFGKAYQRTVHVELEVGWIARIHIQDDVECEISI